MKLFGMHFGRVLPDHHSWWVFAYAFMIPRFLHIVVAKRRFRECGVSVLLTKVGWHTAFFSIGMWEIGVSRFIGVGHWFAKAFLQVHK